MDTKTAGLLSQKAKEALDANMPKDHCNLLATAASEAYRVLNDIRPLWFDEDETEARTKLGLTAGRYDHVLINVERAKPTSVTKVKKKANGK